MFSLINEAKRKDTKKTAPMVYCGLATKEIAGWEIGRPELDQKVGSLARPGVKMIAQRNYGLC